MTPLIFLSTWLLVVAVRTNALTCPDGASQEELNACLEPVHEVLKQIHDRKPLVKKSLLPALFYTHSELDLACDAYKRSRNGCPFDYVKCSTSNSTLRTIQTTLMHFCNDVSQVRHDCVQHTLRNNRHCSKSLLATNESSEHKGQNDCNALYEFYACFSNSLQGRCGTSAVADLMKAITGHGCSMDRMSDSIKMAEAECSPEDKEAIHECFTPLERFWFKLRVQNEEYNKIGFPLYHFSGNEMERMCQLVSQVKENCQAVQRCPSQPIVQFTNALLGYACGHESDTFFKHYQCIRESIRDQSICTEFIIGVWEPGYHRETCLHMPEFLRCIMPTLAARCGAEAISVLAQSIRQYWCDIGSILDLAAIIKATGVDMDDRLTVLALSSPQEAGAEKMLKAGPEEIHPRAKVELKPSTVDTATTTSVSPSDALGSKLQEPGCNKEKRQLVHQCLEPVFDRMLELHRVQKLENYSLPLYHYGKREILELCDLYATAFLQCPFSMYEDCGSDYVVTAANAFFGYFCSPQNIALFHDHYDCISLVIRNRRNCEQFITGTSLMRVGKMDSDTENERPTIDCDSVEQFYECSKQAVDRGCPQTANVIFKQSLRQLGCNIQ